MGFEAFNRNQFNHLEEPMFFGKAIGVARYDQQKYEFFERLVEKQLSFFWRPEEVDISKDRIDFKSLTEAEKHIFTSNLKYQCLVEGTEVLTTNGWIDMVQYDGKQDILVYDLDKETIFWETPVAKVTKPHKGKVFEFHIGEHFKQVVTPEHRMPYINVETEEKGFTIASKMEYNENILVPLAGKLDKKESDFLSNVISNSCKPTHGGKYFSNKEGADLYQAMLTLGGVPSAIKVNIEDDECHVIHIETPNISGKDAIKIEKDYDGLVSCVTVSTGAFIVRYRGCVSVSGNCLLDSVQGRSPVATFLPIASLPELENWIVSWDFSETIHSRSYTHIIRNIYDEPSKIFDDIVKDEHILKRALDISKYYDRLYEMNTSKEYLGITDPSFMRDIKKALYLCLISVNALEAVRFYVSFACSFAFAERRLMEGNAKIIKLISRDEQLHLVGTQSMINVLKTGKDDPEFKEIHEESIEEIYNIFKTVADQEKEWAEYLFKDGSMIGLNYKILADYVEYITDIRIQAIGLKPIFAKTKNPIPWINNWLVSENVQVAPQETEISSYLVGQVESDLEEESFDDFDL